ncbi:MAG: tetrahydrofolate dehydrogenase/cyclohydrolase catalytic domain-containing protein, partial [Paraclostridium sp.]
MSKINCKEIVEKIQKEIINESTVFFRKPKLATILVGERADSQTYVKNKEKTLEKVGFEYVTYRYSEEVSQQTVEEKLLELRIDNSIDGILIQLPLPKHLDSDALISMIPFYKDVDGLTEVNQAKLFMGEKWDKFIQPC